MPRFELGRRYESGYQWTEGFTLVALRGRTQGVFQDDHGCLHIRKIHPPADGLGEYAAIGHSGLFAS